MTTLIEPSTTAETEGWYGVWEELTRQYVERFGTEPYYGFQPEPYDVLVRRALETGIPMTAPKLPPGALQ